MKHVPAPAGTLTPVFLALMGLLAFIMVTALLKRQSRGASLL